MLRIKCSYTKPSSFPRSSDYIRESRKFCTQATKTTDVITELERRGLIAQLSGTGESMKRALEKPIVLYGGFDPTAADPLSSWKHDDYYCSDAFSKIRTLSCSTGMLLFALKAKNVNNTLQVGGATGLIGDPSGKKSERPLIDASAVQTNCDSIAATLNTCLSFQKRPFEIVNNIDWYKNMNILTFLRDIGKHFRVNTMLTKESVVSRLESQEGISFTEFSYQLLQSYDFLHLAKDKNCTLQVGGSDQWGNISEGIDLVHRMTKKEAFGLTIPLLTTSSGAKIGKSEGNATVWLSQHKTSAFDFYQYFMRVQDKDVMNFLKWFTFLPIEQIEIIHARHLVAPELREAQKTLAKEVTLTVHGEEGLKKALEASQALFSSHTIGTLKWDDVESGFKDAARVHLKRDQVEGINIVNLAVLAGSADNKGTTGDDFELIQRTASAKRLIDGGGLYLNNEKVQSRTYTLTKEDIIEGKFCLLRTGKANYRVVVVTE